MTGLYSSSSIPLSVLSTGLKFTQLNHLLGRTDVSEDI